jgi:4-hydroxythreonine-4-phosphate dehydrogenase
MEYLDVAMGLLRSGDIDCLVTAPISKEAIHRAGYPYSGHTEYLCHQAGVKHAQMMLANDRLRFVLLTRHLPLAKVAGSLSRQMVAQVVRTSCISLRDLFGLDRVRLAVCALNPHASDNGLIGAEENTVIRPALRTIRIPFAAISGPMSADVAIARAYAGEYDCVIAAYHDQALIPLKLIGSQSGVNVTLGLPFVRTSPLHGTAFDIAGKNQASEHSFIAAAQCAYQCVQNLKKPSARIS